jgi:hypothetical protein
MGELEMEKTLGFKILAITFGLLIGRVFVQCIQFIYS